MTIVHVSDSYTSTPAPIHLTAIRASTIRRQRVVLVLGGATAVAAVEAFATGAAVGWATFAILITALSAYAVGIRRRRRLSVEHAFRLPPGSSNLSANPGRSASLATRLLPEFADLGLPVCGPDDAAAQVRVTPVAAWRQAVAMAHFMLSYAAGWAMAPLVFALTVLVGRTPQDTAGQRWLANLQMTQERLRAQSMRALAVSAATTASVAGTVTVMGGTGMAGAAQLTASAPASAPGSAGIDIAASAPSVYRVVAGDTLSSIAARFGTTYQALASLNRIANPNMILAGQVLALPSSSTALPTGGASRAPIVYTVRSGDTLSSIAARLGTTWPALAAANGLPNPNLIYVGQVLRISGSGGSVPGGSPAVLTSAPSKAIPEAPPATPMHTPAQNPAAQAQIAVKTALAQVGRPYVWGGASPSGFDCSGLVMYAWASAGVSLPHYTVSQYQDTRRLSESQLQPGDLAFYDTGDGAQPGHVTMYIGNGQVVTADSPGTDVRVVPLDWDGTPMGFGRVS